MRAFGLEIQAVSAAQFEHRDAVASSRAEYDQFLNTYAAFGEHAEAIGPPLSAISEAFGHLAAAVDAAKIAQGLFNDALRAGADTAEEAERRKIALALATGQMSGAEAAAILQQMELNKALEEGRISFADYLAIVADGVITADEFSGAVGGVASAADQAAAKVAELTSAIGALPDSKEITIRATVAALTTSGLEDAEIENIVHRQLGPPRAFGGPVMAGVPYPVGERGPEVFVPNSSGTIIPNHQLGGQTVNITINNPQLSSRNDINLLAEQVARRIRG